MRLNAHNGKVITCILTVLLCAVILLMIGCTLAPYFTISEQYHFVLNKNPKTEHFSLMDVMWTDTVAITEHFTAQYSNFDINDYAVGMAVSFIFAVLTILFSLSLLSKELRRFPCLVTGIFTNIFGLAWVYFTIPAYTDNVLLDLGRPEFMGIRDTITLLIYIGTALYFVRLIAWIWTEVCVSKERKARLALL